MSTDFGKLYQEIYEEKNEEFLGFKTNNSLDVKSWVAEIIRGTTGVWNKQPKEDRAIQPIAFLMDENKENIYLLPEVAKFLQAPDDQIDFVKSLMKPFIRKTIRELEKRSGKKIIAIAMVTEAWGLKLKDPDQKREHKFIRDEPDRQEMILVTGEYRSGSKINSLCGMMPINNDRSLGKVEYSESIDGRLIGVLEENENHGGI